MLCFALAPVACTGGGEPSDSEPGATEGSSGTTGSSTVAATTDLPLDTTAAVDESSGGPSGGTPGCGLAVPAGASTLELTVGAETREYLRVVPEGYDPQTPMPLVLAFHGLGGSADLARLYFQIEGAAEGAAIFVYPQGVPQASTGGQTGWDLAPSGSDVAFFDALVAELSQHACIDPDRIFATGHSFGGYMSNALGCFRAEVLRAIGPVAGGPPFGGSCQDATVAAWLAHGTADEVVLLSQGELARDALIDRNGCAATTTAAEPAPCVAYDGCEADVPVVWCAHEELDLQGHAWPRFAGPAIWAFFEALPPKQ